jgi:hypothetical protein
MLQLRDLVYKDIPILRQKGRKKSRYSRLLQQSSKELLPFIIT